jgi:hypothetical protein
VPKYTVVAHKRVVKFLAELGDEALKERIKEAIRKLVDYPLSSSLLGTGLGGNGTMIGASANVLATGLAWAGGMTDMTSFIFDVRHVYFVRIAERLPKPK